MECWVSLQSRSLQAGSLCDSTSPQVRTFSFFVQPNLRTADKGRIASPTLFNYCANYGTAEGFLSPSLFARSIEPNTLRSEEMNELQVPEFKSYEEEAAFWDNLDTADFMEDDGEWFRFETPHKRAIRKMSEND